MELDSAGAPTELVGEDESGEEEEGDGEGGEEMEDGVGAVAEDEAVEEVAHHGQVEEREEGGEARDEKGDEAAIVLEEAFGEDHPAAHEAGEVGGGIDGDVYFGFGVGLGDGEIGLTVEEGQGVVVRKAVAGGGKAAELFELLGDCGIDHAIDGLGWAERGNGEVGGVGVAIDEAAEEFFPEGVVGLEDGEAGDEAAVEFEVGAENVEGLGGEDGVVVENDQVLGGDLREGADEFGEFGIFAVQRAGAGDDFDIGLFGFVGGLLAEGIVMVDEPEELGLGILGGVAGEAGFE